MPDQPQPLVDVERDRDRDRDRLIEMVEAAYRYADQLAQYRSPHGLSLRYAEQLRDALDRAGTVPVPGSSRRAQEPSERERVANELRAIVNDSQRMRQWEGAYAVLDRDPTSMVLSAVAEWLDREPACEPAAPKLAQGAAVERPIDIDDRTAMKQFMTGLTPGSHVQAAWAQASETNKLGAFDLAKAAFLDRYGTTDPARMRSLGADSVEIRAAEQLLRRERA